MKYEVSFISKLSKNLGVFEADSEDEAIGLAAESDAYQSIGGPCHQCVDGLGDEDEGEFVAFEIRPTRPAKSRAR